MKRVFIILNVLILLSSPLTFAAAYDATRDARKFENLSEDYQPNAIERYGVKVGTKFDYGVPNFLMGWTNIMTEPALHRETTGPKWKQALSTTGSVLIGAGLFVVDTVGGAVNILTSPIPVIIPLPRGGVDTQYLVSGKTSR